MVLLFAAQVTFSPLQFPAGILWLDGKDPSGDGNIPSIGSSLSSWVNKVGGENFIQGAAANRPIFQSNGIFFDGIQQYFSSSNSITIPSDFTIVTAVGNPSSAGGILGHSIQNCKITSANITGNIFVRIINGGSGDSANAFPSAPSILTFRRDSGNKVDLNINNGNSVRLFSDAAQSGNMVLDRVGWDNTINNTWDGIIKEVIIYNTNLSASQITQLNQYLSQKWGIAI